MAQSIARSCAKEHTFLWHNSSTLRRSLKILSGDELVEFEYYPYGYISVVETLEDIVDPG
jgi:hypothetical protein